MKNRLEFKNSIPTSHLISSKKTISTPRIFLHETYFQHFLYYYFFSLRPNFMGNGQTFEVERGYMWSDLEKWNRFAYKSISLHHRVPRLTHLHLHLCNMDFQLACKFHPSYIWNAFNDIVIKMEENVIGRAMLFGTFKLIWFNLTTSLLDDKCFIFDVFRGKCHILNLIALQTEDFEQRRWVLTSAIVE